MKLVTEKKTMLSSAITKNEIDRNPQEFLLFTMHGKHGMFVTVIGLHCLRENDSNTDVQTLELKCQTEEDSKRKVKQYRILLLHKNGTKMFVNFVATGPKMFKDKASCFAWKSRLSSNYTPSIFSIAVSLKCKLPDLQNEQHLKVLPNILNMQLEVLLVGGHFGHLGQFNQRREIICFHIWWRRILSDVYRNHLFKHLRKLGILIHDFSSKIGKHASEAGKTVNPEKFKYELCEDTTESYILFLSQTNKKHKENFVTVLSTAFNDNEWFNKLTSATKDNKYKETLHQDIFFYSEIFVYPSFRRNDLEYSFKQIVAGTQYLSSEIMRFEHHRLSTFANYNNAEAPSLLLMAKFGWYATGYGNETKTFCCSVVNAVWSKDDNPFEIHKHFQPNCSFILGCDLGQVSIQDDRSKPSSISNSNSSSAVLGTPCNSASTLSNSINLSGTENNDEIALQSEETNLNPSASSIEHKAKVEQFPSSTPTFKDKHGMSTDVMTRSVGDRSDHAYVDHTRWLTSDSRLASSFNADCPSTSVEPAARIKSSDNLSDAERVNVTYIENRPRPATWNKQDRESETIHDKPHSDVLYQEPVLPPLVPENPQHVEYTTVGIRASSFSGFPIGSGKTPKEFAIGGFYYRGFGDRTTCFQCGISLQNWSADDDVFVEHARHNPLCQYIRQLKGDDFVKLVLIATGNHEVDIKSSIRYQGVEKESTCLLYCMFISV